MYLHVYMIIGSVALPSHSKDCIHTAICLTCYVWLNALFSKCLLSMISCSFARHLTASPASGAGIQRSATAIKQMLLSWCKSKTQEYEVHVLAKVYSEMWMHLDPALSCHQPSKFETSMVSGCAKLWIPSLATECAYMLRVLQSLLFFSLACRL